MVNVVSDFDFQILINKHLKPPFHKDGDWDVFYADAYDDVYDTHEYIAQLRQDLGGINTFEKAQALYYINQLEPKLNRLMGLMHKSEYKSPYYTRLWSELSGIQQDIPAIRQQLSM